MNARTPLVALACFVSTLAGCTGSSIRGRVVSGGAGVVQVVESGSARVDDPGLASVEVEVRQTNRPSTEVIGKATTDEDGWFDISVENRRLLRDRMAVAIRAQGYVPLTEEFYWPGREKVLLVVLKPDGGPIGGKPPETKQSEPKK